MVVHSLVCKGVVTWMMLESANCAVGVNGISRGGRGWADGCLRALRDKDWMVLSAPSCLVMMRRKLVSDSG